LPDTFSSYDPKHATAQRYRSITRQIERLHRLYLDVVRVELDRIGEPDMKAAEAVLLSNIGDAEVNVKTLMERGYYYGSNASYNLKKLEKAGYLEQYKSPSDRRATIVRLTARGKDICERLLSVEADFADFYEDEHEELVGLKDRLSTLEQAWSHHLRVCTMS